VETRERKNTGERVGPWKGRKKKTTRNISVLQAESSTGWLSQELTILLLFEKREK